MERLSLRINIVEKSVIKTMHYLPSLTVFDVCCSIQEKILKGKLDDFMNYGLFLQTSDTQGYWLEVLRRLDYYTLKNGDLVQFKKKLRKLKVRVSYKTVNTFEVDESQTIDKILFGICGAMGITNFDEYGMYRKDWENVQKGATNTLNKNRDKKSGTMNKKAEDLDADRSIDPSKTLCEEGVLEDETVILMRKFFFSDQPIDSDDPVQLNFLYTQVRDKILDGSHPIPEAIMCEFAGIQCHIENGDFSNDKIKSFDIENVIPVTVEKSKHLEKIILKEYKKWVGKCVTVVKAFYIKAARDLDTYGVVFFEIKEKKDNKNKLSPGILGVSKNSVLRLDRKTNEILDIWPVTALKRWSATSNTLTLDFGDYMTEYYSVQTTEAEQILTLIGGYIDIILKKKHSHDHFAIDQIEESVVVEDTVIRSKLAMPKEDKGSTLKTQSVAKPVVVRSVTDGAKSYKTEVVDTVKFPQATNQAHNQYIPFHLRKSEITDVKPTSYNISPALPSVVNEDKPNEQQATNLINHQLFDVRKQIILKIASMTSAANDFINFTPEEYKGKYPEIIEVVSNVIKSLSETTDDVKILASHVNDNGNREKLMKSNRRLCNSFNELLEAKEHPNSINALKRFREACFQILSLINEDTGDNTNLIDMVMVFIVSVLKATAALGIKAKTIASVLKEKDYQDQLHKVINECVLAASQLLNTCKLLSPIPNNGPTLLNVIKDLKKLAETIDGLKTFSYAACFNETERSVLTNAVVDVTRSLNNLVTFIIGNTGGSIDSCSLETILSSTEELFSSSAYSANIRDASILSITFTILILYIQCDVKYEKNSTIHLKLLSAAKVLSDATTKLIKAARLCALQPNDVQRRNYLHCAIDTLKVIIMYATVPISDNNLFMSAYQSTHQYPSNMCNGEKQTDCRTVQPYSTDNSEKSQDKNRTEELFLPSRSKLSANDQALINQISFNLSQLATIFNELKTPSNSESNSASSSIIYTDKIQLMCPKLHDISKLIETFECDLYISKSDTLDDVVAEIVRGPKMCEEKFADAVKKVATSLCYLIEAAAKVSYPDPILNTPVYEFKLMDKTQLVNVQIDIDLACQNILHPIKEKRNVVESASQIASRTSALCNHARILASKTDDVALKREFVTFARNISYSASNLVKAITTLEQENSKDNVQEAKKIIKQLIEAVHSLVEKTFFS